ncbi:MAG: hypothetical protein IKH78_09395 [Ruminococcus sp.]|nr:hypothetical protein [Ruminococcus sp.]
MEKTLAALSAVVLLLGCFAGCGSSEKKHRAMPQIIFMYSGSFEGTRRAQFCDCEGRYYEVLSDDVKKMSLNELMDSYSAGRLDKDIRLDRTFDRDAIENEYIKLCRASDSGETKLDYPEELPAVEAPEHNWSGICYNDRGELVIVPLHRNTRMTNIYSESEDINSIYKWFAMK